SPCGGRPEERVQLAPRELLAVAPAALLERHQVEDAPVALAEVELQRPAGAREGEVGGRLHRAEVLADDVAVEGGGDVGAQPPPGRLGLLDAARRQAPARAVPAEKLGGEQAGPPSRSRPKARLPSDSSWRTSTRSRGIVIGAAAPGASSGSAATTPCRCTE